MTARSRNVSSPNAPPRERPSPASAPMTKAPETFTTNVPQGKVSPIRRPTKPETKKREMPPKKPPSNTRAQASNVMTMSFRKFEGTTASTAQPHFVLLLKQNPMNAGHTEPRPLTVDHANDHRNEADEY